MCLEGKLDEEIVPVPVAATKKTMAKAGFFSSDRTIEEYNRDIWKLS